MPCLSLSYAAPSLGLSAACAAPALFFPAARAQTIAARQGACASSSAFRPTAAPTSSLPRSSATQLHRRLGRHVIFENKPGDSAQPAGRAGGEGTVRTAPILAFLASTTLVARARTRPSSRSNRWPISHRFRSRALGRWGLRRRPSSASPTLAGVSQLILNSGEAERQQARQHSKRRLHPSPSTCMFSQSRSSFGLPHPKCGSGEPRSQQTRYDVRSTYNAYASWADPIKTLAN